MGMQYSAFDSELHDLLIKSKTSQEELKELITRGLEIGFFENVECEFFS